MKIDFIIGSLNAGGAERVVSRLANYFAEKGNIVRIITFREGDGFELHASIERIRLHQNLTFLNFTIFKAFLFLLKFYWKKSNHPDIISSHIDMMGLATIPISKLYKLKIVVSEHFNHFNQSVNFPKRILWNFLYRYPNTVTVLTNFDIPFFEPKTKKVMVILNPCSFDPISDLDIKRDKVILAVGDLDRYHHKGFDNLLDITNEVLVKYPNWKLKIIGQGEDGLKFLKGKIKDSEINKQVIFAGYRNDVKETMAKSEIFILSSRHEGLPLVLIEAMSQGMACISYDCVSGPSDIITNNIDGILVKDQDKKAMISELVKLLENSDYRQTLRNNTPNSLKKFSIEEIGAKWESLFNEILKIK